MSQISSQELEKQVLGRGFSWPSCVRTLRRSSLDASQCSQTSSPPLSSSPPFLPSSFPHASGKEASGSGGEWRKGSEERKSVGMPQPEMRLLQSPTKHYSWGLSFTLGRPPGLFESGLWRTQRPRGTYLDHAGSVYSVTQETRV